MPARSVDEINISNVHATGSTVPVDQHSFDIEVKIPEGITGPELIEKFKSQAKKYGAQLIEKFVTAIDFTHRPFSYQFEGEDQTRTTDSVILATGASAKWLGVPSEEKFVNNGISACATCDGPLIVFRNKHIFVVGGGDSACEEALYLAGLCKKVYMIVRRDVFRASKIIAERVRNTDNIEILFEHLPKEVVGDKNVDGVIVHNKKTGEDYKVEIQGFFLAIGHKPNSSIFAEYLDTDDVGYIQTIADTAKTNIEGIFACGDVQDSQYRQAVTAAGSGCMAAIDAERYLSEKGL